MAETFPGFELVVGDLAHELRPHRHPLGVLAARPAAEPAGHASRVRAPLLLRDLGLQRFQLGDQLLALGGVEGRRVPHVVHRSILVVEPEQQGPQR